MLSSCVALLAVSTSTEHAHLVRRDEMQQLFVHLTGLQRFIDLNVAGFRKALKKHDKVLAGAGDDGKLKESYMPVVLRQCCTNRRPVLEVRTPLLLFIVIRMTR